MKNEAKPGTLDNLNDASVTLRYFAPRGHTLEDCQRPDYWRAVIRECGQQRVPNRHAWNKIEILAEDGSWEAELRILSVAEGLVHTRLLWDWKQAVTPGRVAKDPDGYVIEHIANNGWRVLDENGTEVAAKLTTRDAAVLAAKQHAKKVAA